MNKVFTTQLGRNLEVYVDDMVVKTTMKKWHVMDLKETLASIIRYDMRLNLDKCIFGVQVDKCLRFMLSNRGIEAYLDKFQVITDMRSPSSKKEVQQLTGRLVALSHFFVMCWR